MDCEFHSSQLVKLPFLETEIFLETGTVFVSGYLAAFLSTDLGRAQFCRIPSNFVCFLSEVICDGNSARLFLSPWMGERAERERDVRTEWDVRDVREVRDGYEISLVDLSAHRTDKAPRQSLEASTGV